MKVPGVAMHGHAAGQRQRALAAAQRLRGQVQGDQRGGAGGVDGDRRALEAERVGDAAGDDAAGAAGAEVAVDALGALVSAA